MAAIAIITARGGSKRIPRKNIRSFLGRPIIAYSIEAALQSGLFDEVMVSTDDLEIAGLARQLGARVPFMRSARNADDFATTKDVLVEVLEEYRRRGTEFEFACCLYPTAPFVTAEKLRVAFARLRDSAADTVLPIVRFSFPIQRSFRMEGDRVSYLHPEHSSRRSQDLPPAYHDAGQFYFFRPTRLLETGELVTANTVGIEMPLMEVQDLDDEEDWGIAKIKFTQTLRHLRAASAASPARLVLGAAQFGLDYGISNTAGRVRGVEVREILQAARVSGLTDIDTAQAYGTSERILGETGVAGWNVYTKLSEVPARVLADRQAVREWVSSRLRESLDLVRSDSLAGLMLHHPDQLTSPGGAALYEALVEQRERGLVNRIGISIYGPKDLEDVPASMAFDFVQGPLNVLDMRLARSGWLSRLAEARCTFFARSVFLQGLLLMPASRRPKKFDRWAALWQAWDAYLRDAGLTAVQACLRHVARVPNVGKIIVGLTSVAELEQAIESLDGDLPPLPESLVLEDDRLLEPTNWPSL